MDKSSMHAALVGNGTYMNNAELFGYHVKLMLNYESSNVLMND